MAAIYEKMSDMPIPSSPEDFWLFGYGSLIWKPPPHFDIRVPGYIEGYVRRFWQASEDHRGYPESPGRVVTLIERSFWETLGDEASESPSRVYGAAYHIPAAHVNAVKSYLDIREINGYSIQYTAFYPSPSKDSTLPSAVLKCMVYIGLPSNPQFLGRQSSEAVAEVIATSVGPSGANDEYLFMLEQSLDDLSEESGDEYVKDLAVKVRALIASGKEKKTDADAGRTVTQGQRESAEGLAYAAVERELERVRSGEGVRPIEEAEKISQ